MNTEQSHDSAANDLIAIREFLERKGYLFEPVTSTDGTIDLTIVPPTLDRWRYMPLESWALVYEECLTHWVLKNSFVHVLFDEKNSDKTVEELHQIIGAERVSEIKQAMFWIKEFHNRSDS
jgi:hypothetical protein